MRKEKIPDKRKGTRPLPALNFTNVTAIENHGNLLIP
jgi:hypothetical protein